MEYGLIGGKLGHSYSKTIHELLCGYSYELCPLPTEADVRAFLQRRQFKAINVTIPYKKLVMEYCSFIDPRARAIGAVKRAENVRALRQNGVVLFIDRPVEALAVGGDRPLSSSAEALRTMEAQRRPLYLAAADAVISNTGTLAETLAAAQEALDEIFDS